MLRDSQPWHTNFNGDHMDKIYVNLYFNVAKFNYKVEKAAQFFMSLEQQYIGPNDTDLQKCLNAYVTALLETDKTLFSTVPFN